VGVLSSAGPEYRWFSRDLSVGLVEPRGPFTPLTPEASEQTPYVRRQAACEGPASASECYVPLVNGDDVSPPGTEFGGHVVFQAASGDGAHVVVQSSVALTEEDATPKVGVYEWSANAPANKRLKLVSVLPGGAPADGAEAGVEFVGINRRHAVSEDGSRVFWSEHSGSHRLFVRDVVRGETLQISGGAGLFQAASGDGKRVFFIENGDLKVCEIVEVEEAGVERLKCVSSVLGSQVQSLVPGVSEDGSYVYFIAKSVLSGGEEKGIGERAVEGAFNLYMRHHGEGGWEPARFIGVLSAGDEFDWDGNGSGTFTDLTFVSSRVSPDGRFFAFMSERPLTGYDNRDAVSGHPDEEVYLYDSGDDRLVCASCNPTGERPMGIERGTAFRLVSSVDLKSSAWFAANLPAWTSLGTLHKAFTQSRYLSDSGRLFFNSSDALVAKDTNSNMDVYEYEPPGVGDCTIGSPTFSSRSGGCVGLISSGVAVGESAFLDASESGGDVFFLTGERLASSDVDTALDVYDAHVCGEGWECRSEPVSPPACVNAESCRPAPSPQPSIYGAPSSATFSGAGNLSPPAGGKGSHATRTQTLVRALKACRKRKPQARRMACVRQARKRYGSVQSSKARAGKGSR
jgi:hypothetical protein